MKAWPIAFALLSACSDVKPAPSLLVPLAPDGANDPAYAIHAVHDWYLIGDGLTPGDDLMTILVDAPSGIDTIDAYVANLPPVRMTVQDNGQYGAQISIANLPAGRLDVLLTADNSPTAFARIPFHHSAAYYVMVSTDWDFSDPGLQSQGYTDRMHAAHPGMQITQFVGPYTFTDPAVTADRATALATWVAANHTMYGDEIALHIHPYCNFVADAGLTCITDQSTVYAEDTTGYTIKVAAYGRTDFATLLNHAKDLFVAHGLGTPTLFRAGGWTATIETLQALQDTGFVGDSSAINWQDLEVWKGKELYRWNAEHWAPIDDVSQPYWPNQSDILATTAPTMPILEVPINGVMVDYVTVDQMTAIFDANFNGVPLAKPTTMMMGFHPSTTFDMSEYDRVDGFLSYSDLQLYKNDAGPVIYTTLGKVLQAFPN